MGDELNLNFIERLEALHDLVKTASDPHEVYMNSTSVRDYMLDLYDTLEVTQICLGEVIEELRKMYNEALLELEMEDGEGTLQVH